MTKTKRIVNIILGIIMLICSGILLIDPDEGCDLIVILLQLSLAIRGLQLLFYYFSMARYMVGGIATLYRGLITLDLGLFLLNLSGSQRRTTMLYLIGMLAFSGLVDALRAMDARRMEAQTWRYQMISGVIKILIAISCLFHLDSAQNLTMVFCGGLTYSAVYKIISACRKTAIVYIE